MPEGSAAVIPPWIQAANPAEYWMKGLAISQRQQQLDQEAQQAQAELQQKALQSKAELDISKAYHEMNYKMRQEELAEEKRKNDVAIQEAARKAAALMELRKFIDSGGDPIQGWMKYGPEAFPGVAESAFVREAMRQDAQVPEAWVPGDTSTGMPGHFRNPHTGQITVPSTSAADKELNQADMAEINDAYKVMDKLRDQLLVPKIKPKLKEDILDRIREQEQRIANVRGRKGMPNISPAAESVVKWMARKDNNEWWPHIKDPKTGEWVPVGETSTDTATTPTAAASPTAPSSFWPVVKTAFATYPPGLQY